ncbi:coiled-coil domain-containing protein 58-like isoform X3 [Dendronephthya gigantea]|uniref:coiled-coil domain-containing protein 58-like isoform X3 n=1 Tax=Dendronephthya gigantea TaxID=151771 RepID=UPI00106CA310|nr:coiled-coil domain-containing protein 58-like isoform X3 [Dendronephthya gigantea]
MQERCESNTNCQGKTAEFYFKCGEHHGRDEQAPLSMLKSNIRNIPCITCSETSHVDNMAGAGEQELSQMSCEDFTEFKEALKVLRLLDDKIIYSLNKSVPTTSFAGEINAENKCKELYTELLGAYSTRENAIKKCVTQVSSSIQKLQERRQVDEDNPEILRHLRKEQTKLRLMRSELNVEEVVQQRSLKVFNEKCWKVFKPPSS